MTYDERQEIGQYIDIVKKNAQRLIRSIDMMQDALGDIECKTNNDEESVISKDSFLRKF